MTYTWCNPTRNKKISKNRWKTKIVYRILYWAAGVYITERSKIVYIQTTNWREISIIIPLNRIYYYYWLIYLYWQNLLLAYFAATNSIYTLHKLPKKKQEQKSEWFRCTGSGTAIYLINIMQLWRPRIFITTFTYEWRVMIYFSNEPKRKIFNSHTSILF